MSYILDALRKAEAERALGAVPTLHVQTLTAAAPAAPDLARKRLLQAAAALGVLGVLCIAVAVAFGWWRQPSSAIQLVQTPAGVRAPVATPVPANAPIAQSDQAPGNVSTPVPAALPAAPPAASLAAAPAAVAVTPIDAAPATSLTEKALPVAPVATTAPTATPAIAATAVKSTTLPKVAPAATVPASTASTTITDRPAAPADARFKLDDALATPAGGFAASTAASRPDAPSEQRGRPAKLANTGPTSTAPAKTTAGNGAEQTAGTARTTGASRLEPATVGRTSAKPTNFEPPLPTPRVAALRELPENLQRDIPSVVINGYIYTPDAAERSALINNRLTREGEQVAPGLTLERLLPQAAILNYRGTRFSLGY